MDVGTHYRQMMAPLPILSPALSSEVSPPQSAPNINPSSTFEMTPMWGVSSDEYYANTQNPPRSMEIDMADETIESHLKRKRTRDTVMLLEHLSVASPSNRASCQPLTPSDSSGAIPNEQPLNSSSSVVEMESGSPRLDFSPECREAMLPSRPVHYDAVDSPSEVNDDDVDMAHPDSPRPTSTSPLEIPWPRLSAFRPLTRRSRRSTRPRSPSPIETSKPEEQPPQLSPAAAPTTVQLLHHMLLKRGAARDGEEGPVEKRVKTCLPRT